MYIINSNSIKSSLTDDDSGITIEWQTGKFNSTQKINTDNMDIPEGADMALWVARKMREMGDYIAQHYPQLV